MRIEDKGRFGQVSVESSGIEEPDFNALRWTGPKAAFSKIPRSRVWKIIDKMEERWMKANWWQWDVTRWETYLEHNKTKRKEQGDNYQAQDYETALLVYANWLIQNPHLLEDNNDSKYPRLSKLYELSLTQFVYSKRDLEPPFDISFSEHIVR